MAIRSVRSLPAVRGNRCAVVYRFARCDEQIALISFAPIERSSVWREVGPVYIHAESCDGYTSKGLRQQLAAGPCVLRTYRADESMNYDHNTV